MQPVVVLGVCRSYAGHQVLRDVDLVVERGSFHGVIGPNGAGKTTLVEIIQGARRAQAGSVELLGRAPLPRDPRLLVRVGIQPQATAFFSRATVWEHLSAIAAIFGASQARAEQLIEAMDLGHVRNSRVERASGSERQKLAVASAMVHRPEVLFLDEPTAALDATARHDLVGLLASAREEGTTVVYTTHHLEEAERLCDVVTILDGGRVVTTASPSALVAGAGSDASVLLPGAAPYLDVVTGLDVVTAATVSAGGLVIHVRDVGEVFAALGAADVPTAGAQVHSPTLEDAFMELTGKKYES
ncbi:MULTISPECIES: ABC transporter ATP-binding protein [unclassified Actinomyces]|uniref:ABC transporter ATP-binding protein n=1 Tax=unclassified Actinomyces TaxID=2609248 RepID=UPI0013743DF5|nr:MULTISPECIES: ABC transporter ATP-binding protein [unclassified Actinomyces]MBW3068355.1 ABC transporter ATP-binding protein [Actinomyces sp. 594]NDR53181.1 ABC transporter ATP-binding protein [Actinomyces sp. 565]QHO90107.1 ABC transporter ATP-binding protein [Actinomyces sp. 432]